MKNILRTIFIFVVGALILVSCEKKESNWDAMTKDWDPNNTTYYLQFVDASKTLRTDVADGALVDINTTVAVALLGSPQSSDISVPLTVNAATTAPADSYELSATSITIPAGQSSGSVNFTGFAAKLVQDETVKVVLDMDAGANAAPTGTQLNYSMFRICALTPDNIVGDWTINMVDSYGDGWNGASITVLIDGVGTDYTIAGASGSATITVPAGSQTLSFEFNSGDWDSEVTFEILGPNGALIGAGGPSPAVGEIILDACKL